ncbi:suppressor of fused domain protein [Rubinisphaera margarita]|uniref:suppressor of fused domain protein n=1 Tax=Rubinisphaera margarita TaxID=2909586 RepID=UPI001EE88793|nr:suppressor of fused domain protein [Rubinisphaera margarita]MCG6158576.1 suppressor of fused domain protein [Rubinisphaera margarita]
MIDEERSESGSPIYRHQAAEPGIHPPDNVGVHLEAITAHLEKHLGACEMVYHEIVSDLVHLDVLQFPPTDDRPFHTLVTSGVSDKPMNVPAGLESMSHVELMINLPAKWPMKQSDWDNENHYWPLRWLKMIGRMPHQYNTWIGWGHTIPNGDPAEPIADTNFIGVMLSPPYWKDTDFFQMTADDETSISFFNLVPLYREEMDLKLQKGAEPLEDLLEKNQAATVLNPKRKNVAKKRRWFGLG